MSVKAMGKDDRAQKLIDRGWTSEGAKFLTSVKLPFSMRKRLFGFSRKEKSACVRCGYVGPALDAHHVHGRKISDETIVLCANCHREIHAGTWTL